MAEECLVLNVDSDNIGVTDGELRLMRAVVDESLVEDLNIATAPHVPALKYSFSPVAPGGAISPVDADRLLTELASKFEVRRILRTWREPVGDAPDGSTWIYIVELPGGFDEMQYFSTLSSQLSRLHPPGWPIEVIAEGAQKHPYLTAAYSSAVEVWHE